MFKQPKGLLTIASSEMWERFSFYTMQYSLVLYAAAEVTKGGLGFSDAKALHLTGVYGGAVYATPILGGYLADRYLGRVRAVHIGGILMAIGHFILSFHSETALYLSLFFLAIGCGFFKPNITSLVGDLYRKNDERRDAGYSIFYSAINVGALLPGIFGGILNEKFGFYASFLLASVCMLVGVVNFFFFARQRGGDPMFAAPQKRSVPTPPFRDLPAVQKQGVYLFLFLSLINVVWQIAYNQWAGTLNLFTDRNVDRVLFGTQVPTLWFESSNPLFIILLSPLFAWMYTKLNQQRKHIPISWKLSLGYFFQSLGCFVILPSFIHLATQSNVLASPWYLLSFYFLSTVAELFTMPVMFAATSALAPKGYEGRLMGIFIFTSLSAGSYLAGVAGSFMVNLGHTTLFLGLGLATAFVGVVCLLLGKKINFYFTKAL